MANSAVSSLAKQHGGRIILLGRGVAAFATFVNHSFNRVQLPGFFSALLFL
jgi:hypothetical protein